MSNEIRRRDFLRLAGGGALAVSAATLGLPATATAATRRRRTAKRVRPVTLGFIALTDCASLVMAHELGYFEDRDLEVTLVKQASWPATPRRPAHGADRRRALRCSASRSRSRPESAGPQATRP